MTMQLSAAGAADLRLHEGIVYHFYVDSGGVGTIGSGFTWWSHAFRDWWFKNRPGQSFGHGATITAAENDEILIMLCASEYGVAVNNFLGKDVPQHVFDGMVSPVYNIGPGSLAWTWAAAAKAGNYHDCAARLAVTACTDKHGNHLAGLVRRRADEGRLIELGIYVSGGSAPSMPTKAQEDISLADGKLVRGERGNAVMELQNALIAHGDNPGKPDGIFGYGTESAVLAFQRTSNLTADGIVGHQTGHALGLKWAE